MDVQIASYSRWPLIFLTCSYFLRFSFFLVIKIIPGSSYTFPACISLLGLPYQRITTEMYRFVVLEGRSPRLRCQRASFLLRTEGRICSRSLSLAYKSPSSPHVLPLYLSSVYIPVSSHDIISCNDTCHIELEATLMTYLNWLSLQWPHFQIRWDSGD